MLLSESYKNRLQKLAGLINEAKMEDLYDKYFSDISKEDFDKITNSIPNISQERNDYKSIRVMSNWLINLYRTGNLKIEDLYKAKEYLTLYYLNINDLLKNNIDINLNKYKNLPDLFNIVKNYKDSQKPLSNIEDESELLTNKYFINNDQAKKIFEDSEWLVVSPKTLDSSKFYGCTSEWCTTFPTMFNTYNSQGPLYIIIDKSQINNTQNPFRRFQFHFESGQYMDMYDRSVMQDEDDEDSEYEEIDFLEKFSPNLRKWYIKNKQNTKEGLTPYELQYISEDEIYNIARNKFNSELGVDFILSLKSDIAKRVLEKLFIENENFTLGKTYDRFVSQEIRDENVKRAIDKLDYYIDNFLTDNSYKYYFGNNNNSIVVRNVSEDLIFAYIKSAIEKLKKRFENEPKKFNSRLSKLLIDTTDFNKIPSSSKEYIYKNIDKLNSFAYSLLSDKDKKEYFLNMIKLDKIKEGDIYNLRKSLGEDLFKKYIEYTVSKNKRTFPSVLENMTLEQQRKYVQNIFLNPSSPYMSVEEWMVLKKELKDELYNSTETYNHLSKKYIDILIQKEEEEKEKSYQDYMNDKYL